MEGTPKLPETTRYAEYVVDYVGVSPVATAQFDGRVSDG